MNLLSWRLSVSEVELTYDDTEILIVINSHALPCFLLTGFVNSVSKLSTLVWFSDDFCLIFTTQDFVGRITKFDNRYWIETDFFIHSFLPTKSATSFEIKGFLFPTFMHPIHKTHLTQVSHVSNSFHILKHFVA